jgi:hypothetical protein
MTSRHPLTNLVRKKRLLFGGKSGFCSSKTYPKLPRLALVCNLHGLTAACKTIT